MSTPEKDIAKMASQKLQAARELHQEIGTKHYMDHDVLVVAMSAVMTLKGIEVVNPGTMDTAFELVDIYEQMLNAQKEADA